MTKIDKIFFFAIFTQALFPLVMLVKLFLRRKTAVINREVSFKYFRSYQGRDSLPEQLIVHERHYANLFEMPIYFIAFGVLALTLEQVDQVLGALAWLYVLLRLGHSIIHLGSNNINYRAIMFGSSCLVLLMSWFYLAGKIFLL